MAAAQPAGPLPIITTFSATANSLTVGQTASIAGEPAAGCRSKRQIISQPSRGGQSSRAVAIPPAAPDTRRSGQRPPPPGRLPQRLESKRQSASPQCPPPQCPPPQSPKWTLSATELASVRRHAKKNGKSGQAKTKVDRQKWTRQKWTGKSGRAKGQKGTGTAAASRSARAASRSARRTRLAKEPHFPTSPRRTSMGEARLAWDSRPEPGGRALASCRLPPAFRSLAFPPSQPGHVPGSCLRCRRRNGPGSEAGAEFPGKNGAIRGAVKRKKPPQAVAHLCC